MLPFKSTVYLYKTYQRFNYNPKKISRFAKRSCADPQSISVIVYENLITVKWGESGLAGRVGTKFRPSKTETHLHEQPF